MAPALELWSSKERPFLPEGALTAGREAEVSEGPAKRYTTTKIRFFYNKFPSSDPHSGLPLVVGACCVVAGH